MVIHALSQNETLLLAIVEHLFLGFFMIGYQQSLFEILIMFGVYVVGPILFSSLVTIIVIDLFDVWKVVRAIVLVDYQEEHLS